MIKSNLLMKFSRWRNVFHSSCLCVSNLSFKNHILIPGNTASHRTSVQKVKVNLKLLRLLPCVIFIEEDKWDIRNSLWHELTWLSYVVNAFFSCQFTHVDSYFTASQCCSVYNTVTENNWAQMVHFNKWLTCSSLSREHGNRQTWSCILTAI